MVAHVAEVENRTGLGDVCSQYHGGCLVKLKEGAPLVADRLPITEQPIITVTSGRFRPARYSETENRQFASIAPPMLR